MALNKHDILNASSLHKELVSVPEWGGDVYVRVLTVGERIKVESYTPESDSMLYLVSLSMCDEDGKSIFGQDELAEFSKVSFPTWFKVKEAALKINKFGDDDEKKA